MYLLTEAFLNQNWSYIDILTEDDLRCRLFQFLKNNNLDPEFDDYELHSEIRRYGDRREAGSAKLKYRSDLVYINKNELMLFSGGSVILPSKGFGFSTYKGILELKLRRTNGESDNKFIKKIQDDIDKLLEIIDKTQSREDTFFYIIAFDKKSYIEGIENRIQVSQGIRFFYKYIGNNNETNN